MNTRHSVQRVYSADVGALRHLQHRLLALRAGLKAALRAFRKHSTKHPQR